MNSLFKVDVTYRKTYLEGWDARMSDIFVNPYVLDFDSNKYRAWQHGWEDADIELESDDGIQQV